MAASARDLPCRSPSTARLVGVATVSVRIELNQGSILHMLRAPRGIVGLDMRRRGRKVQRVARRNVHSRTGRLAASIEVGSVTYQGAPGVEVGTSLYYARWVHDGTGIYGPAGQPIRPVRSPYLKFPLNGRTVYARTVRGQRANPYLRNALHAAL